MRWLLRFAAGALLGALLFTASIAALAVLNAL